MKDKKDYLKLILISAVIALIVNVVMSGSGLTGFAVGGDEDTGKDLVTDKTGMGIWTMSVSPEAKEMVEVLNEMSIAIQQQGQQINVIRGQVDALVLSVGNQPMGPDVGGGVKPSDSVKYCQCFCSPSTQPNQEEDDGGIQITDSSKTCNDVCQKWCVEYGKNSLKGYTSGSGYEVDGLKNPK